MSKYLAKVIQNLLKYSEQFDNAVWAKTGTHTFTANAIIAPDGTLTGDLMYDTDTGVNAAYITQTKTIADDSLTRTWSVYLKEGSAIESNVSLHHTGGTPLSRFARINWATHTVDNGTIEDVGNEWYRISISLTNNSSGNTTAHCRIYPASTATGATGSVYMWGGQFEEESTLGVYQKTEATALTAPREILNLTPEWDFKEKGKKIESRTRTRTGAEYVYKWGDYDSIKFSVMYVNSEFKSVVNSWWNTNADIRYIDEVTVSSVHITNKETPIGSYIKPYNDSFKGTIELSTY